VKRSTPPDRPPRAPEEDLAEANARWTTSSTPSAHTTRTCATPSGTAETSSILWGTADPSNLDLLPRREEHQENRDNPSNRRREEVEPSRASIERSTSSSADTGRRKARDSKSSTIIRYWWRLPVHPPHTDGLSTRSPSPEQISGSISTTQEQPTKRDDSRNQERHSHLPLCRQEQPRRVSSSGSAPRE
jgi:hypothetical protein